jgi:hypothetical protein
MCDYGLCLATFQYLRAIMSSVACLDFEYYCTLFQSSTTFWKRFIEPEICSFNFSINISDNFSFQEEQRLIWSKTRIFCHVKYILFLSYINGTLLFSTDFQRILTYQIHVDASGVPWIRRTDRKRERQRKMELIIAYSNTVQADSTCLHRDPYTTQTSTQDRMMPYIDYLQADVH